MLFRSCLPKVLQTSPIIAVPPTRFGCPRECVLTSWSHKFSGRCSKSLFELTGFKKVRNGLLPFDLPKLARTHHIQCFRWPTLFSKTENVPKRVAFGELILKSGNNPPHQLTKLAVSSHSRLSSFSYSLFMGLAMLDGFRERSRNLAPPPSRTAFRPKTG